MISLSLFMACSGPKNVVENPEDLPFEVPLSAIELPLRISKADLEDNLNDQLGEQLFADDDLDGEGLEVIAEKTERIELFFSDTTIQFKVPVRLKIKKPVAFTTLGAKAALSMDFSTNYQIDSTWALSTKTELSEYQWTEKPKLTIGGVSLPVQFIASQVLKRTKDILAEAIDEQVRANFDLRKEMDKAWDLMHDPVLLSEEYKTWIILNPKRLEMQPIRTEQDTIKSLIFLESQPQVFIGDKPQKVLPEELPAFTWREEGGGQGFDINIQTAIPFSEAEALAKESMIGETYTSGKRSVTVEDLALYGQGSKMVVETTLSGSYKGKVNLVGEPRYNANTGKLKLANLDVELKTRNVLYKSLGWLFKGVFKSQIQSSIDYYLDYYLTYMRESLQEEFTNAEVAPGITMSGDLERLEILDTHVTTENIQVLLQMAGGLDVNVKGISSGE
ncbi:MAG: DUF4403 family protein [Bacteroidota bacterium]